MHPPRPGPGPRLGTFPRVPRRVRYFFSDIAYQVRTHPAGSLLAGLALAAVTVAAVIGVVGLTGSDEEAPPAPAPEIVVQTGEAPEQAEDLGFPAFATRNTTRVAGPDPIADAAGIALATFPSGGAVGGPAAVTLLEAEDWAAGVAAASLVAAPVGSPILLTSDGELPSLTASALAALAPGGGAGTGGKELFAVGGAPEPDGFKTRAIDGANAAAIAAEVAEVRQELVKNPPGHVLIASSDDPAFAMPAAAWAARSGDPVLFAQSDSVPTATLNALKKLENVPVYVIGGPGVISNAAVKQIEKAAGTKVERAATADDPVTSAIEFARYSDGTFGWDINDPGHGFVIASTTRPADAGAASPLSGSGTWGPLLLTDDAAEPPSALLGYLLDLKPGYEDDPTRALYNHIWIVGDTSAVSVDFQVEVDEIAEVAPVKQGDGEALLGPSGTEPEGGDRGPKRQQKNGP